MTKLQQIAIDLLALAFQDSTNRLPAGAIVQSRVGASSRLEKALKRHGRSRLSPGVAQMNEELLLKAVREAGDDGLPCRAVRDVLGATCRGRPYVITKLVSSGKLVVHGKKSSARYFLA